MYLSQLPNPPYKAPAGYQWEYEIDGLSGLGKFKLKKTLKKIGKVVKKVIKPVAIVGLAWWAAPAVLPVLKAGGAKAAALIKKIVAKRKSQGATDQQIASEVAQAGAAAGYSQEAVTQAQQTADIYRGGGVDTPGYAQRYEQETPGAPAAPGAPQWLIPALVAGGGLLLSTMLAQR